MLRFGTPVTDSKGRKRGIVMVNYLGDRLISRFNVATSASGGHTMLLDHDGFYLKGLRPEDEWGFMFNRGDLTVARSHPDAWQHISKESKGQFQDADGLWTFDTVYPKSKDKTPSGKETSTEGRAMMQAHAIQWKVVTHLASDRLFAKMEAMRERIVAVVILLLGMLLIGSFKLARIDAKHKQAEEEIESLAFYDPLTQLPNRRLLLDRLHQALALSIRTGRQGALLFIDLDNFKSINDTQGHDIGDLLLVEVANRMQSCVREVDTTARLGGDEFVVLLEDLDADEQAAGVHAEAVGEKIRKALGQPYLIKGNVYHSTASIGMTLFRGSVKTTEEMLKRADVALYQAKAEGRNTLRFFDPAMQAAVANRVALESDLRCAISEQEQLRLYYQPQIDSSGRLIGAEALVRWRHPERGMVSPAEFIPLAEESGLILPLGHWVLATACQQLVAWAAQPGTAHLTLAVNVSPKQFRLPTFVEEVLTLIDYFGVTPARLKLEITESLLLDDVDEIITKMGALKARGINFSMDDFGTGYSSLSYLKRLPLYQLKIDKSFVRDVLTDPNDAAIARTIIALAKTMNLAVIAEGVETEAQREFLELNGCHAFQGYLFGKPVPIEQFDALLEQV